MPETRESDLWISSGIFLAVFAVYCRCAYPYVAPRDSADLALAAVTSGVAHPPGYPLYALLGRLWLALFPFGNAAYRLNLLSGAAGACACAAVFLTARRFSGRPAALAAALALAWSAPLWKFCALGEMYSLNALFIVLLVWLAEGDASTARLRADASAFLFGLGLVNHQSLILFLPGWLWLWRGELGNVARRAGVFFLLGLSVYAWVWLKLGDAGLALAVITRRAYGTFTLFAGFSRALGVKGALGLLWYGCSRTVMAAGALTAFLAAGGAWDLWRRRRALTEALALSLLVCGPVFILATRLDLSEWVARSVLEPAFIAPAVFLCLLAAAGLEMLANAERKILLPLAFLAGFSGLPLNAADGDHRLDLSAYDYLRDLRRELPPASAVLVGGDTALFGLRFLEAVSPRTEPLKIVSSAEGLDPAGVARARERGRVFVLGLSMASLRDWGLLDDRKAPQPQGLVQEVSPESPGLGHERAAWALSTLRWGPALASGESYAHDVRLSYAFAHYLTARIEEISGPGEAIEHDRWARLLDPEDYRLQRAP